MQLGRYWDSSLGVQCGSAVDGNTFRADLPFGRLAVDGYAPFVMGVGPLNGNFGG